MSMAEDAIALLAAREPRCPRGMAAALGCSTTALILAMDAHGGMCRVPPPDCIDDADCWWWTRDAFLVKRMGVDPEARG